MTTSLHEAVAEPPIEQSRPKKALWWRILRIVLAVLLVLVLAAAVYLSYLWLRIPQDNLDPLKPGNLTMANVPDAPLQIGPYAVAIDADAGSDDGALQLMIADAGGDTVSGTERKVWFSSPGTAFLSAGVGRVDWKERYGFFWADVERSQRLTDQSIETIEQTGDTAVITGRLTSSEGVSAPYRLTLEPRNKGDGVVALGMEISVDLASNGEPVTSVMVTAGLEPDELVHGFGEQFRALDLVGTVFPVLVQEQGIGRGEQPITLLADLTNWAGANLGVTYAAWPTFVTSANRSFALADVESSGGFGVADLRRDGQVSLETWSNSLSAEVLAAESPTAILQARAAGSTFPELAEWSQDGAVLGLQGGTDKVRSVVAEMQAAGAEISGVWLQDWVGKRTTSFGSQLWWTWQLDEQQYPGWDELVADLNAEGIEVLTYVNPFLADASEKDVPGIRNLYAEAEDQGFLIKNDVGETYVIETVGFPVGLMDLTNPAAREWYAEVIATEVIGKGASGFMADFGEALPFDAVLHEGNPLQQHNRYPQLWAETVRMACDQAGEPDCLAFMRASFLGSPEHVPMQWAGDQMVTFSPEDGLLSVVLGMNAGGVSGNPLWHSDIGGYTSINAVVKDYVRPSNLNARWAEMQAFGTMMRTHETNRPEQNQQVYETEETRAAFARATQIFVALKEYRSQVIEEAVTTGVPAMRHTWLVYPGTTAAEADFQFFLGSHLLMAPVTSNEATTTTVSLPPGTWVHVLTGETFPGDQEVEVQSPIGTPAAFVEQADPVGAQIRAALQQAGLTTG